MLHSQCDCRTSTLATVLPRRRAIELLPGEHFLSATLTQYERVPELDEHWDGELRLLGCRRVHDGADDSISPLAFVTSCGTLCGTGCEPYEITGEPVTIEAKDGCWMPPPEAS